MHRIISPPEQDQSDVQSTSARLYRPEPELRNAKSKVQESPLVTETPTINTNLDLLRSFAVLCVLVCHVAIFSDAGLWARTLGAMGVMLFFVHTAMVLMQSLERQDQRRVFVPFIVRRVFRIYPVAMLVTSAVIVFRIPETMNHGHMISWNYTLLDVIANLTLAQNFVVPLASIVPPAWSLSYEVQMYLLLPALYLMIRNGSRLRVLTVYAGIVILSYAVCSYCPYQNLFSLAPCFAAGIVAYRFDKDATPTLASGTWPIVLFISAVLVVTGVLEKKVGDKQFWVIAAMVGLFIPYFKRARNRFLTRSVSFVARYSYGIYLLHFFCIWIAFEKMGFQSLAWRIIAFLVLLLFLSVVSFHLVEQPCIQLGKRLAEKYVRFFASQWALTQKKVIGASEAG